MEEATIDIFLIVKFYLFQSYLDGVFKLFLKRSFNICGASKSFQSIKHQSHRMSFLLDFILYIVCVLVLVIR